MTRNLYADPARVTVLSGGAFHTLTLPGPMIGGLRSSGTRFYAGVTGKNTTAGVYGFGATGDATRVATFTAAPAVVTGLSLSSGYLTTADGAVASLLNNGSLWRRPASGSTAVTLGAETRLAPQVAVGSTPYDEAPAEFSAARGVVRAPGTEDPRQSAVQLIDRSAVTRTLPTPEPLFTVTHVSGPYASVNGRIYRADGTLALDLSAENNGQLALFGRTVIYQSGPKILLRDVEKPTAAPTTLASTGICDQHGTCADGLAAWYDRVAWERLDGTIVIRTLSSRTNRTVDAGGSAWELRLSDNALSWRAGADSKILDLGSSTSKPVELTNLKSAVVDSHLVAGINATTFRATVRTLPLGAGRKTPVRLIGTLAAKGFNTRWAPQFDLTKSSTGVKLTVKKGTTTVRALTGTAPDGSIRNLMWDGKNTAGTRVAAGAYTYTLTATAADGEGAPTPVTGTVTVR